METLRIIVPLLLIEDICLISVPSRIYDKILFLFYHSKGVEESTHTSIFHGLISSFCPYFHKNRGGRIRTGDPLVPGQVRYQTALHPDFRMEN